MQGPRAFCPGQDTSRLPGELKDVHSGASASCVKHDAILDLVTMRNHPQGILGLLASPGTCGHLSDAKEGLGG